MSSGTIIAEPFHAAEIAPARRRFAHWIIYGVIGVHVVAMIAKIDQWPLSYFGMYAGIQPARVTWHVPYGITPDGREVRLQDDAHWEPMGPSRLSLCLRRLTQRTGGPGNSRGQANAHVNRAVGALLAIYEANRKSGMHDGPPLAGLRLYEVTWRLDPRLANLDAPDRRELVSEYVVER